MKKTISFGKIDFNGTGRKINEVTIKLELKEKEKGQVFTASGNVWNNIHSDIITGGQCLEELAPFLKGNKLFNKILGLWERNHLNDMHAGTKRQEDFLKDNRTGSYEGDCELLKKHRRYTDKGYRYGSAWLYEPIGEEDLKDIKKIISE